MKLADFQLQDRLYFWATTEELKLIPRPASTKPVSSSMNLVEYDIKNLTTAHKVAFRLCGVDLYKDLPNTITLHSKPG